MSDFGIFEASSTDGIEEENRRRQAQRNLDGAIFAAREQYGPFLAAATDRRDFNDRVALVKTDMMKTVEAAGVLPVTGVMRKVVKSLRPDFSKKAGRKTAGIVDDFNDWFDGAVTPGFNPEFEGVGEGDPVDDFLRDSGGRYSEEEVRSLYESLYGGGTTAAHAAANRKQAQFSVGETVFLPDGDSGEVAEYPYTAPNGAVYYTQIKVNHEDGSEWVGPVGEVQSADQLYRDDRYSKRKRTAGVQSPYAQDFVNWAAQKGRTYSSGAEAAKDVDAFLSDKFSRQYSKADRATLKLDLRQNEIDYFNIGLIHAGRRKQAGWNTIPVDEAPVDGGELAWQYKDPGLAGIDIYVAGPAENGFGDEVYTWIVVDSDGDILDTGGVPTAEQAMSEAEAFADSQYGKYSNRRKRAGGLGSDWKQFGNEWVSKPATGLLATIEDLGDGSCRGAVLDDRGQEVFSTTESNVVAAWEAVERFLSESYGISRESSLKKAEEKPKDLVPEGDWEGYLEDVSPQSKPAVDKHFLPADEGVDDHKVKDPNHNFARRKRASIDDQVERFLDQFGISMVTTQQVKNFLSYVDEDIEFDDFVTALFVEGVEIPDLYNASRKTAAATQVGDRVYEIRGLFGRDTTPDNAGTVLEILDEGGGYYRYLVEWDNGDTEKLWPEHFITETEFNRGASRKQADSFDKDRFLFDHKPTGPAVEEFVDWCFDNGLDPAAPESVDAYLEANELTFETDPSAELYDWQRHTSSRRKQAVDYSGWTDDQLQKFMTSLNTAMGISGVPEQGTDAWDVVADLAAEMDKRGLVSVAGRRKKASPELVNNFISWAEQNGYDPGDPSSIDLYRAERQDLPDYVWVDFDREVAEHFGDQDALDAFRPDPEPLDEGSGSSYLNSSRTKTAEDEVFITPESAAEDFKQWLDGRTPDFDLFDEFLEQYEYAYQIDESIDRALVQVIDRYGSRRGRTSKRTKTADDWKFDTAFQQFLLDTYGTTHGLTDDEIIEAMEQYAGIGADVTAPPAEAPTQAPPVSSFSARRKQSGAEEGSCPECEGGGRVTYTTDEGYLSTKTCPNCGGYGTADGSDPFARK